uniref:Uncharacterized protein n=1 Tax=Tanacetum cinerariifolium TaxID=118510 RepID=A0A699K5F9_TANCI|nr:hypothetical protein [Tanacetum cinerariifolium]
MGKGSALPTDFQHAPTILQPSSSQPQKTQILRKPKRKNTQVPQPSGSMEHVADEAVYKELDARLVWAATTTSSLEAKQDNGGGSKCQEAMRDTVAQTRVLDMEKTKSTQALEITNLKLRVKKLEKKQMSRTHKLKRLYKAVLTARVDSSEDDKILGKDASKQGRKIHDIDVDKDITLVNDQDDAEMFDVNDLHGEEGFVEEEVAEKEVNDEVQKVVEDVVEDINAAKLIVNVAQVSAAGEVNTASIETTVSAAAKITTDEITLAQVLLEIKTSKSRAKGIVLQEPKPMKPKKKDQITLDEEATLKLQAKFDEEEQRLTREKLVEGSSKRAREELTQKSTKKQKVDDNKEMAELKELMKIFHDEEDVTIDVIPLAIKSPKIIDWKIHKEVKKNYYQIIRADGNSKMYMVFNRMLKEFDREDLEDLYNLLKAKYGSTKPVEDLDLLLWGDLKTMFEPHVEDQVSKKQHGYKVME